MESAKQPASPEVDRRPWGADYKVKRLEVDPGKRLSYQKHHRRAEHWMIVAGVGKVTLDGRERLLHTGETVDVALEQAHRMENPGIDPLVFIEIQRGDYLGEDDIVRLEDDFGRTG